MCTLIIINQGPPFVIILFPPPKDQPPNIGAPAVYPVDPPCVVPTLLFYSSRFFFYAFLYTFLPPCFSSFCDVYSKIPSE